MVCLFFTIVVATSDRLTSPNVFDDIFNNASKVDDVDDSAVVDDENISNLAFKIPRQKVDELRRNLLNVVPHYFNIHEGISIIKLTHYSLHNHCTGCGSWCIHRPGSTTDPLVQQVTKDKFFVNIKRVLHKDPLTGVVANTSLCADVLDIFQKYATVSICERIIFGYHSNGNESRHSLIHRTTGNKRVPFWRGLLSRAQLQSVLRYDMSEEAMMTMILTEAGLQPFAPAVKKSFAANEKLRQHVTARGLRPDWKMKRKLKHDTSRKRHRTDKAADGGNVYETGCDLDDNHVLVPKVRKAPGVLRCTKCFERGHKKIDCDADIPDRPIDTVLPKLNVASSALTALPQGCALVILDIESTSGNRYTAQVIQLAASVVNWPTMEPVNLGNTSSTINVYCSFHGKVDAIVKKKLRFMDWDAVNAGMDFKAGMQSFFKFLCLVNSAISPTSIIIAAHNGLSFDIPVLYNACKAVSVDLFKLLSHAGVTGVLDTLNVSRAKLPANFPKSTDSSKLTHGMDALFADTSARVPFQGSMLAHNADSDVAALLHILKFCTRGSFSRLKSERSWPVVVSMARVKSYSHWMSTKYASDLELKARRAREENVANFVPRQLVARPRPSAKATPKESSTQPKKRKLKKIDVPEFIDDDKSEGEHDGARPCATQQSNLQSTRTVESDSGSSSNQSSCASKLASDDDSDESDITNIADDDDDDHKGYGGDDSDDADIVDDADDSDASVHSYSGQRRHASSRPAKLRRLQIVNYAEVLEDFTKSPVTSPPVVAKSKVTALQDHYDLHSPQNSNLAAPHGDDDQTFLCGLMDDDDVTYLPDPANNAPSTNLIQRRKKTSNVSAAIEDKIHFNVHFSRENIMAFLTTQFQSPMNWARRVENDLVSVTVRLRSTQVMNNNPTVATSIQKHVPAHSFLPLLPPLPNATSRSRFLNQDIMNSYSELLSKFNPKFTVFSTWIVQHAIDGVKSLEEQCQNLRTADFNNDTLFFPVHLVTFQHWALIRMDWDGRQWNVEYLDSIREDTNQLSSRGDNFVQGVILVLQAYFTLYRDKMLLDRTKSRRWPTPRIVDHQSFKKKSVAPFTRIPFPAQNYQLDDYNCGCFVLHSIESALGNAQRNQEFPQHEDYMEMYRQRILLSLLKHDMFIG